MKGGQREREKKTQTLTDSETTNSVGQVCAG